MLKIFVYILNGLSFLVTRLILLYFDRQYNQDYQSFQNLGVNIQISKVEMEIDNSTIDRIAAVLNPTALYTQSFSGSKGPMYSSFLAQPLMVSVNLHT